MSVEAFILVSQCNQQVLYHYQPTAFNSTVTNRSITFEITKTEKCY